MENAHAQRIVEPIAGPQRVTGSKSVNVRLQDARLRLDSLLSNLLPFLYSMVKKVTLYYHKDCDGCMELKPILKKVARSKGWKYKQVNIERCKTPVCDSLGYVPAIEINGRLLNEKQMETFLEREL